MSVTENMQFYYQICSRLFGHNGGTCLVVLEPDVRGVLITLETVVWTSWSSWNQLSGVSWSPLKQVSGPSGYLNNEVYGTSGLLYKRSASKRILYCEGADWIKILVTVELILVIEKTVHRNEAFLSWA